MSNFLELKNKNVLVTGGANGIGASIVAAFQKQNARVFFCDTDSSRAITGQEILVDRGWAHS